MGLTAFMPIDPRTPVLVGAGQLRQKVEPADALEPVDMIAEAARAAADDAGAPALLGAVDSVRIVSLLSWRYADPGAEVATRIGASPRQTAVTPMGGNSPQTLVNKTAIAIAAGQLDVVLLGGAEAWRTRRWYGKQDLKPDWTPLDESASHAVVLGEELTMTNPSEASHGITMPVQLYPVFETAIRAAAGRSVDDHLVVISELWARFSEVAAGNPYAWIQEAKSAEQIRTASADNRMVGFPYTKQMNSNNDVDQAAALILCSVEAARRFGVPEDRWVFPLAGTDAHDTPYVSNRQDLHSSPAIRAAGRRVLELADVGIDDVAHFDLYSCFPSAVEVAAAELGLALDRQLTVTGGLTFAGGPWNDYVTHGIATMAGVVRDDPGSIGLCSANGGYLTKHAMGLYSTTPPAGGFRWDDVQDEVDDATSRRELADDHAGAATIESYTVMHDRDGSMGNAIVACLTPDGRRTWATSTDGEVMKAMTSDDLVGRAATLHGGTLDLA
ncbi:MAG: acetyl-CoA C-acetyltransferase [Actinomycetota bacterium]|nr:acetyl-CoA C-acetyltransferase [Actinomycetota bacterium]